MQVHKIEILVIDTDEVGAEEIKNVLENTRYPNWCIAPDVKKIETKEIGEWSDDHPLNKTATADDFYKQLFN